MTNDLGDTTISDNQGSRNYGYEVLIKCAAQVTQSLSRDPKTAALLLHSKQFVSDRLLEEISSLSVSRAENGQKLYTAIMDVVKLFPCRYTNFISTMEEKAFFYEDLLTVLREAYVQLGELISIQHFIMLHKNRFV